MKYDATAYISIGKVPRCDPHEIFEDIDSAKLTGFFSANERSFKDIFESWLKARYLERRNILIMILCVQESERVSIETRSSELVCKEGKVTEADVRAVFFGNGDFSNIGIGVCTENYKHERRSW